MSDVLLRDVSIESGPRIFCCFVVFRFENQVKHEYFLWPKTARDYSSFSVKSSSIFGSPSFAGGREMVQYSHTDCQIYVARKEIEVENIGMEGCGLPNGI